MREGTDLDVVADAHAGPDEDLRLHGHVATEARVGAQPHRGRVDERHPAAHRPGAQAGLHERLGRGQLGARVDTHDLLGIGLRHGGAPALGAGQPEHVAQVVLALGVAAVEPLEQREQGRPVGQQCAGVAQIDAPLCRAGVGVFDDLEHLALLVQHHPAVVARIGGAEGQGDELRRARLAPARQHGAQRLGRNERRVAEDHEHLARALGAVVALQRRLGAGHRVAGAQGLVLHNRAHIAASRANRLAGLVHAGGEHDHESCRRQRAYHVEHMIQHGPAGQRVKRLGPRRLHAGSLASGQHDNGELGHGRSSRKTCGQGPGLAQLVEMRPDHATGPIRRANHRLLQLLPARRTGLNGEPRRYYC